MLAEHIKLTTRSSLLGVHLAVTEESQAQTKQIIDCFGANPARGIQDYNEVGQIGDPLDSRTTIRPLAKESQRGALPVQLQDAR
jgi:hypothetical protein